MRRHRPGRDGHAALAETGGERTARLQELIREEASSILRDELQDPRLQAVRVTAVDLSADAARARIWYTLVPDSAAPPAAEAEVEAALGKAARFVRSRVGEALALKRTPELVFRRDPATHAFDQPLARS